MTRWCAAWIAIAALCAVDARAGNDPVPAPAELKAAIARLQKELATEYAVRTPEGKRALGASLLGGRIADASVRYAELVEAERLAIEALDLDTAYKAFDARNEAYAIDEVEAQLALIKAICNASGDAGYRANAIERALAVYELLRVDCRPERESILVSAVSPLVSKITDPETSKQTKDRLAEAKTKLAGAAKIQAEIQRKIVAWSVSKKGQKIDRGECVDFVYEAISNGGGRPAQLGYRMGRRLGPSEMPLPGDLIHLESVELPDGTESDAHHVAVITKVISANHFECLHQHWCDNLTVQPVSWDFKTVLKGRWAVFRARQP